ncbi:MAG: DUF4125 family protein [Clostridiales bacterium]|nr:DUF4125 family protein [Clostridiales bacterium]
MKSKLSESKKAIIADILEIEWHMFESVPNVNGKAACQEDKNTFRIMRSSQLMEWPYDVLQSYQADLSEAEKAGRNLMTEKYARMMASTSPKEYEMIKDKLMPLDENKIILINKIAKTILEWRKTIAIKYPYVSDRGRPLYAAEDTPYITSFETYLKGELSTYSIRTLELYYDHLLNQKSKNINASEIILENMVKQYGYASLDEANEAIKKSIESL